jgi:hypothetical protein
VAKNEPEFASDGDDVGSRIGVSNHAKTIILTHSAQRFLVPFHSSWRDSKVGIRKIFPRIIGIVEIKLAV